MSPLIRLASYKTPFIELLLLEYSLIDLLYIVDHRIHDRTRDRTRDRPKNK